MAIFHEGQYVEWNDGGPQVEAKIIELGTNSAHIKWASVSDPTQNGFAFVDLFDIEPVTASKTEDPLHLHAVRKAYDTGEEDGVIRFLASNSYLGSWQHIAQDALAYVEERISKDASMELVDEQLSAQEKNQVVAIAALSLLRDAFGEPEAE